MRHLNVLVTCAGAAPAVAVLSALKSQEQIKTHLFAVNSYDEASGFFLSNKHEVVPPISDEGYIDRIKGICRREGIDVVFPILDDELMVFAEKKDEFEKMQVNVVSNNPETVKLCSDKYASYEHAKLKGIEVPRTMRAADLNPLDFDLPAIVKPRVGRGTRNVFCARTRTELKFFVNYVPDAIVQEYLPGAEFTLDLVTDMNGRILAGVPRERIETKAGIAVRARTVRNRAVLRLAHDVAEGLSITPRANIQCKEDGSGRPRLVEVNPKFSSSLVITTRAGVNMPLIVLKLLYGLEITDSELKYRSGIGMTRYLTEFFYEYGGRSKKDLQSSLTNP